MSSENLLSVVFLSVFLILGLFAFLSTHRTEEVAIRFGPNGIDEGVGEQATIVVVIRSDGRYYIDDIEIYLSDLVDGTLSRCGVEPRYCEVILDAQKQSPSGSLIRAISLFHERNVEPKIAAQAI